MIQFSYPAEETKTPLALKTQSGGGSPPLIPPLPPSVTYGSNGKGNGNGQGRPAATTPPTSIPAPDEMQRLVRLHLKRSRLIERQRPKIRAFMLARLARFRAELSAWQAVKAAELESPAPEASPIKLVERRWQAFRDGRELRIYSEGESGFDSEEHAQAFA